MDAKKETKKEKFDITKVDPKLLTKNIKERFQKLFP
jgi:hypothetical protein